MYKTVTIMVIVFLLTFNLYGEHSWSVKGGINYSTAESIEVGIDIPKRVQYDYRVNGILFLSFEKKIKEKFYFNIDLGINP